MDELTKIIKLIIEADDKAKPVLQKGVKDVKRYNNIITKQTQKQVEQARITKATQKYAEQYGMAISDVTNGLQRQNLHVSKSGKILDMHNKVVGDARKAMIKAKGATQKFHMEFLSLMFGAQAVAKSMDMLIMPVMKLTGITEVWRATLITILGPVLIPLAMVLMKLMTIFMNMPKWMKYVVTAIVLLVWGAARAVAAYGQWMLFLLGINMVLMKHGILLGFMNKGINKNTKAKIKNTAATSAMTTSSLGLLSSMMMLSPAMTAATAATTSFTGAAAAAEAVTVPLWLIIATVIVALVGLIALIWIVCQRWNDWSNTVKNWGTGIETGFEKIGLWFKKWFYDKPKEWIENTKEWIINKWNTIRENTLSIFEAIGTFFKKWFWDKPIEWVGDAVSWIVNKWNWVKEKASGILQSIGTFFKKWFWAEPLSYLTNLIDSVKSKLENIKMKFDNVLSVIGGWFKKWFYTKPKEWIDSFKGWIDGLLTKIENIKNKLLNLPGVSHILEAGGSLRDWLNNLTPWQHGGIIPQTAPYLMHAGETVIPAGHTISPNITVYANVSSNLDIRNLAAQLNEYWMADFNRLTKSRGA